MDHFLELNEIYIYIYIYLYIYTGIYIYKVEKNFFFSEKLEKENKENKFYKLIWLGGEENNFLRFYKL